MTWFDYKPRNNSLVEYRPKGQDIGDMQLHLVADRSSNLGERQNLKWGCLIVFAGGVSGWILIALLAWQISEQI